MNSSREPSKCILENAKIIINGLEQEAKAYLDSNHQIPLWVNGLYCDRHGRPLDPYQKNVIRFTLAGSGMSEGEFDAATDLIYEVMMNRKMIANSGYEIITDILIGSLPTTQITMTAEINNYLNHPHEEKSTQKPITLVPFVVIRNALTTFTQQVFSQWKPVSTDENIVARQYSNKPAANQSLEIIRKLIKICKEVDKDFQLEYTVTTTETSKSINMNKAQLDKAKKMLLGDSKPKNQYSQANLIELNRTITHPTSAALPIQSDKANKDQYETTSLVTYESKSTA